MLKKELLKADEARRILDSEYFKGRIKEIEEVLVNALCKTAFIDEKLREKLAQRLAALREVVQVLNGDVDTGKLAQHQLDADEKQKTLRQKFGNAVSQFR